MGEIYYVNSAKFENVFNHEIGFVTNEKIKFMDLLFSEFEQHLFCSDIMGFHYSFFYIVF